MQEGAKQKNSFFAVRIFNLTRIVDFVKGEIANVFSMRHFWYKVANFLNFSKIVPKYDARCRIQSGKIKKKQEEATR